jgi:hypothetical protein
MARHTGEDFVAVESIAITSVLALQSTCQNGSEFDAPQPDCFSAHDNATLSEEIFDISMAEIEAIAEPDCVGDDIWWEPMALISVHPLIPGISADYLGITLSWTIRATGGGSNYYFARGRSEGNQPSPPPPDGLV